MSDIQFNVGDRVRITFEGKVEAENGEDFRLISDEGVQTYHRRSLGKVEVIERAMRPLPTADGLYIMSLVAHVPEAAVIFRRRRGRWDVVGEEHVSPKMAEERATLLHRSGSHLVPLVAQTDE